MLDSENPYTKIKIRSSLTNYNKTRRVRSNTKKIYLSPSNIAKICGGLTDGKNGAKICLTKNCAAIRHPA